MTRKRKSIAKLADASNAGNKDTSHEYARQKKNRQTSNNRTVEVTDDDSDFDSEIFNHRDDPDVLATRAMKMNDKDKDAFIKKLQELGAEAGFQEA